MGSEQSRYTVNLHAVILNGVLASGLLANWFFEYN
jgi:hypothetical protein